MPDLQLMGQTVPVVAQPWNRLASKLGAIPERLEGLKDADVTMLGVGRSAHELLSILAPEVENRIPLYRWLGYDSQAALDASDGRPGDGDGPTVPEVAEAFRVALEVNGWDLTKGLSGVVGQFVDPTVLKDGATALVGQAMRNTALRLQSQSGASQSTNGSQSSQREATSSEDGPSRASAPLSPAAAP